MGEQDWRKLVGNVDLCGLAVIKGSGGALRSETGHLDKETYLGLGIRRTQTSSLAQRETVYRLFEVYMRRKREHGHYDPADR